MKISNNEVEYRMVAGLWPFRYSSLLDIPISHSFIGQFCCLLQVEF
jgi:hypothetical protein